MIQIMICCCLAASLLLMAGCGLPDQKPATPKPTPKDSC